MAIGAASIASIALGAGTAIAGGIQAHRAKKNIEQLRKDRPSYGGYDYKGYDYTADYDPYQYKSPGEIQSSLDLYKQRASRQGLPGQSIIERQLQASTARGAGTARRAATTSAGLLGATTSLYGQEMQSLEQLAIAGAREKAQREAEYGQMQMQAGQLGMQQQQMQAQEGWKGYQSDMQRQQLQGSQNLQLQQLQAQEGQRKYQYNQLMPYQEQMSQYQSDRQSGFNMLSGGVGSAMQGLQGYATMKSEESQLGKQIDLQEKIYGV